ncbi:MAG: diguanylate cyclase [Proteobacteria bacterium]|nr:diguanylate cyclase [Desulfocapsa sp.]MBU3944390.1 diguanylate cyclase [Pseudomonadota bacterium]MCG2744004.1 diguanylate cyclase [Desulfobacteraceae bacterium]MBU3982346.1 diguanylate cyclase [Pseudomonadota bacterium]MBU4029905.1 diguanylate cyclase [Pseudomonadota bacterium]
MVEYEKSGLTTAPLCCGKISVGVALCPDQADEASALISLADKTLYLAKEAGRDRVVFSG